MRHHWIAGAVLLPLLAGCEASRPGFLARLQQDCRSGDQNACVLLAGPAMAPGPQPSAQPASRPRTAVQYDVDAIMQGMDRSHAESRGRIVPDEGS